MHFSEKADVIPLPSLSFGGARVWSTSSDLAAPTLNQFRSNQSGMQELERRRREEERMKVVGNATALLVAISIMVGLLVAQRGYQNSWHEPTVIQSSTGDVNAGTPEKAGGYKVVMK